MLIDCDNCEVRNIACGGCVVSTLLDASGLSASGHGVEIDERELEALDVLADLGLVPPLRHTAEAAETAERGPTTEGKRVS